MFGTTNWVIPLTKFWTIFVKTMLISNTMKKNVCDHCYCAKQHRLSFPNSEFVTYNSFNLVHIDIWGPFGIASVHGHR